MNCTGNAIIEDFDDLIDRHYANIQDYQTLQPLVDIASDRLFQARYRFNKFNFEKRINELNQLFEVRRTVEACSPEQIVGEWEL